MQAELMVLKKTFGFLKDEAKMDTQVGTTQLRNAQTHGFQHGPIDLHF